MPLLQTEMAMVSMMTLTFAHLLQVQQLDSWIGCPDSDGDGIADFEQAVTHNWGEAIREN